MKKDAFRSEFSTTTFGNEEFQLDPIDDETIENNPLFIETLLFDALINHRVAKNRNWNLPIYTADPYGMTFLLRISLLRERSLTILLWLLLIQFLVK